MAAAANCRQCGFSTPDCDLMNNYKRDQGRKDICKGYTDRQLLSELKGKTTPTPIELEIDRQKGSKGR